MLKCSKKIRNPDSSSNIYMKVDDLVKYCGRMYVVEAVQKSMYKIKSVRPYWPAEWVESCELTPMKELYKK